MPHVERPAIGKVRGCRVEIQLYRFEPTMFASAITTYGPDPTVPLSAASDNRLDKGTAAGHRGFQS